ncbi:MAG: prolyl oligopeptidase family serine peptidase [Halobacteria archaeon]
MAYDIERYLNVRSAFSPSFSHDGEEVAFLMDTTGTSQIWKISEPEGWPRQITYYDEPVGFASWSPERSELIFGMDEGGNEMTQLYRLSGDGSELFQLTDCHESKHMWGGWSHDGERLAYTSNRRNPAVFDVYVQDRDSDDGDLILEGDGWYNPVGWSPDDDALAVMQSHSNFDQDVYVVDLDGGKTRLTSDTEARYGGINWGPMGDYLYLVTDLDADTLYMARIGVESGEIEKLEDGGDYNVSGLWLDEDTGRFVYGINFDGYTRLKMGELRNGTFIEHGRPRLPQGVAGGLSWDTDADNFAVTFTSATMNANVYVVDFPSGHSKRWTDASTAGIPRSTFTEPKLVKYSSFDGLKVPGFLTVPEDAGKNSTPVVVDIHGGPESQRRPSFSSLTQYFVENGYAVFEPNVRGSSGYGKEYIHMDDVEKRMDSVRDIKAAVEWLEKQVVVDSERIAAMGGSYGGFMVLAALSEYPEIWSAGVDIVGIANFVTFLENTGEWRRELREREYGSLEEDREFLEQISPINNADCIEAPLFVLHGANDPRVPVEEAEQIAEEVESHGVPVEKMIFDDEGHGIGKLENKIKAYGAVVEFLDEYL